MAEDVREGERVKGLVEFENAAEEWSNVTEVTAKFQNDDEGDKEEKEAPPVTPLVTVDIVIEHLRSMDEMESLLGQVKSHEGGRGSGDVMRRLLCCLRQSRPLPPHQRLTVKLIQATALIAFSNEDPLHLSMLRTIYRQLTSSTVDCPRYGSHWETIGFQGTDPSTDLRGVGILGLVQAVYLVTTPEVLPFTRDLFSLSRSEGQEFPLLVLSLNITRITLHVLRDGLLNRHVALEADVWATFNFYYTCLLYHVYYTWKAKHLSIRDCGPLLQQTETLARSRVGELIVQFEKFLSTHYTVGAKQAAREQILKYSSRPIRGQYSGHVICHDQSEASSGCRVTRVNDSAV